MAGWNGSGTFTGETYTWVNDLNAGIPITASRMDTNFSDVTTGINACMAKNGENAATGNLNIGGFRLTSVGNATARTDAIPAGQIQDGGSTYIAAAGTNTITATLVPAITAYANGQTFAIKAANTTTAAATLAFNGLSALNMYYSDGTTQLLAGSIIQNNIYWFTYNSSLNSSAGGWEVQNPSRITGSFTGQLTGVSSGGSGTVNYSIGTDGKSVDVWFSASITGASNSTSTTMTGIPSSIVTTTSKMFIIRYQDNGAGSTSPGNVTTGTSTTWTLNTNMGTGGWTSGGPSKGILAPTPAAHFTTD